MKVVATEAVDEQGRGCEIELGDDVALNSGGGSGGKGDNRGGAKLWEIVAEGAVIGAEIVAPGGDAVGFVDGDERWLAAGEHLGKAGDAHALGRDEEELEIAVEVVAAGLAGGLAGKAGVDAGYAEAGLGQLAGLIVHKGDQWGDDEAGAAAGEDGKLIAERLSRAGGHDEQDVLPFGRSTAHGFLISPEGFVAECVVKERFERGHSASVSFAYCLLCSNPRQFGLT